MKCQFCHCVVTQDQADQANSIRPCDLTPCPACATSANETDSLADDHESAAYEDRGDAAFGRED